MSIQKQWSIKWRYNTWIRHSTFLYNNYRGFINPPKNNFWRICSLTLVLRVGQSRKICTTPYSTLEKGYVTLGDSYASATYTSVPRPSWETTFHCAPFICLAYRMHKYAQNVTPVTCSNQWLLWKVLKKNKTAVFDCYFLQLLDTLTMSFLIQYEKECGYCTPLTDICIICKSDLRKTEWYHKHLAATIIMDVMSDFTISDKLSKFSFL